ncbi:hypothetical protein GCM10007967_10230 [Xylanimonas ulmi]
MSAPLTQSVMLAASGEPSADVSPLSPLPQALSASAKVMVEATEVATRRFRFTEVFPLVGASAVVPPLGAFLRFAPDSQAGRRPGSRDPQLRAEDEHGGAREHHVLVQGGHPQPQP